MSYTPSLLEITQTDLAGRLSVDPFFAGIPVFVVRPREQESFTTIQTKIDQMIGGLTSYNGKSGAAVYVLMPTGDAADINVPGPRLNFAFVVRVQELPIINMGPKGTQKSAEEIALKVLSLLHHFNPGKGNVIVAAADALTPSSAADPKITIDVKFIQTSGVQPEVKVVTPQLTSAPAVSPAVGVDVTITCATDGASLFYSIDGSYPSLPYTAPVNVAASAIVRAVASKSGLQQSDIRQLTIS